MTAAEALLEAMDAQNALLVEIRDELRSWRAPAGPMPCEHPEPMRQDLSSMGEKWIRCRACKTDIIREGTTT